MFICIFISAADAQQLFNLLREIYRLCYCVILFSADFILKINCQEANYRFERISRGPEKRQVKPVTKAECPN